MELRHLRYFIAVAENHSFRVASERIRISQPAITRQVQDLESELGFALFHRTSSGVLLTPAGEVFLRETRIAMSLISAATRSAKRVAMGLEGSLRIGFVEHVGWDGLVPEIFARFLSEAPQVQLELLPSSTPDLVQQLFSERIDGAFVYTFNDLPDEVEIVPIVPKVATLAIPRQWNWPDAKAVPIGRIRDIPFVMLSRHVYPSYLDYLSGALAGAGVDLKVVQEVTTETAILSLVSAGVGAAIVSSANRSRSPARVSFFEIADLTIPIPLAFAHLRKNFNPALTRFVDLTRRILADEKADDTTTRAPS